MRGRRQLLIKFARAAWLFLSLVTVILVTLAIPARLENLSTISSARSYLGPLTPADLPALEALGLSPAFYGSYLTVLEAASSVAFLLAATLLFWRSSDNSQALLFSFALIPLGAISSPMLDALAQARPAYDNWVLILRIIGLGSLVLAFTVFPDGRFVPRWTRWLTLVWWAFLISTLFLPQLRIKASIIVDNPTDRLLLAWMITWLLILSFAQVYRYRRVSSQDERQQTKWVVFGLALMMGIGILFATPRLIMPAVDPAAPRNLAFEMVAFTAILLSQVVFAGTIVVAILRFRLYDLDILINRTLVYGTLTALLGAAYFACVIALQAVFRGLTGQGQTLAIVISTLAIAALFSPLRNRLQAAIDRRFYRARYDAQQMVASFGERLRDQHGVDNIASALMAAVADTVQPESLSLWLKDGLDEDGSSIPSAGYQ